MISLVITVLNEENTILPLLVSINKQTKKPDEVVIVDGGSKDETYNKIQNFKKTRDRKGRIRIFRYRSNRPIGRNFAVEKARGNIVAITDAGCVLDERWFYEITKPFEDKKVEVVSGYYKSLDANVFEKCVAVYTLVMPDKIDPANFLPSSRSMAIRKSIFKKAGEFPKNFPLNEDYVFAHSLKRRGYKFYFTKKAIAFWKPRENLLKAFKMFYYFALGDALSDIFRPKVILVFLRYLVGIWLTIISYYLSPAFMIRLISYILSIYIAWSIIKNYRYIKKSQAFIFLPLLQFTSDIAVMIGTSVGFVKSLWGIKDKL